MGWKPLISVERRSVCIVFPSHCVEECFRVLSRVIALRVSALLSRVIALKSVCTSFPRSLR